MDICRGAAGSPADQRGPVFLLRTFTKRIGRTDLSLLVADRGVIAAEAADDPVRMAALGHILLAQASRMEPKRPR